MTPIRMKISGIAKVKGGKRLPKGEDLLSTETSNPYIRAQDIRDGRIRLEDPRYLTPEQHQRLKRYTVSAGDVCIVIVGANVGDVGIVPASLSGANLTENAVKLTDFKAGYVPQYVNYCLSTIECQAQMQQFAGGAAQPKLGIYKVLDIEIPVLPEASQHRVAEILTAYDDLIENNRHRITILEEMARMIYREWFVNFRFPGHEKLKMVESEIGLIPAGWTVEPLRELTTLISRGISPHYDDEAAGRVINQKCIRDGRLSLEHSRKQSKNVPEDKLIRLGDVLINSTGVGTLGRVAQVLEPISDCTVDSHVSIVRPRDNSEFLGKTLLHLEQHFERLGVGSTGQTELSRERIASTRLVVPTPDLQKRFSQLVAPMNGMIVCCLARNSTLHQTRDLLLPKLISGEVSVEQIEDEAVAQGV